MRGGETQTKYIKLYIRHTRKIITICIYMYMYMNAPVLQPLQVKTLEAIRAAGAWIGAE